MTHALGVVASLALLCVTNVVDATAFCLAFPAAGAALKLKTDEQARTWSGPVAGTYKAGDSCAVADPAPDCGGDDLLRVAASPLRTGQ